VERIKATIDERRKAGVTDPGHRAKS
jgi:hypothetical protein